MFWIRCIGEAVIVTRVVTDVLLLPCEKVKLQLSRKINRLSGAPVDDGGRARGRQWAAPGGPWCRKSRRWGCARRGLTSPAPATWATQGLPWRRRRGRWGWKFSDFTVNSINYSAIQTTVATFSPCHASIRGSSHFLTLQDTDLTWGGLWGWQACWDC